MAWVIRVFEVVVVAAGRGVGRSEGRCWPLPLSVELAFPVFDVVVHSLAEDWVVVLAVAVVDGVFHKSVRCCGCVQWSWYGS